MTTSYPPEVLEPPSPTALELTLADEIAELKAQRRDELIREAMRGLGPFWLLDDYDCEQELALFLVLRKIIVFQRVIPSAQERTDADRWQMLMGALRTEVESYADVTIAEEM